MNYKIETGTILKIDLGFLQGSFKLIYCGMPNDETFVLSPLKLDYGPAGFSPNVFYNSKINRIKLLDYAFEVIEVTREYIILAQI